MKTRAFKLTALSLLCAFNLNAADELLLKNGEVLRGTYLKTEDGKITFKSDTFGEVSVPADTATLKKDVPSLLAVKPAATTPATPAVSAEPEKKKGWVRELLHLPDTFSGSLTGSITDVSGTAEVKNTVFNLNFGMKLEEHEWNVFGSMANGEVNGVENTDNFRFGAWEKWYFAGDGRWFLHSQASFYRDNIQFLDSQITGFVGLGYYFLKTEKYQWQLSLGGSYDEKEYADPAPGIVIPNISGFKIGFFEQFTAKPLPYINFTHTFFVMVDPDDSENYDYMLNFMLSTPLTANTSVGVSYNRIWNSSVPAIFQAAGVSKDNTTIALQLGYTF